MRVKIFADGASIEDIKRLEPVVSGFTTNPTLMRKAGVTNYEQFAREVMAVTDKPVSFEVIADDLGQMRRQACKIASWGNNIYVKIPVSTTHGDSTSKLIHELTWDEGIRVNVTAITTARQVAEVFRSLNENIPSYVSVFAGRIADTGRDPVPSIRMAVTMSEGSKSEVIWASPRELLNIVQADECGCHVITVTPDLLAKMTLLGKGLLIHSLDTVKMFYDDALASGLTL